MFFVPSHITLVIEGIQLLGKLPLQEDVLALLIQAHVVDRGHPVTARTTADVEDLQVLVPQIHLITRDTEEINRRMFWK